MTTTVARSNKTASITPKLGFLNKAKAAMAPRGDQPKFCPKRFVVGKLIPDAQPGQPAGRRIRWVDTMKQAVALIGRISKRDPKGVANGEYYIDGPCQVRPKRRK